MRRHRVAQAGVEAQRLRTHRLQFRTRYGIAAGEQRHVVAHGHQLVGQECHDALGAAIQLRRHGFRERRDLGNAHRRTPRLLCCVIKPRRSGFFAARRGRNAPSPPRSRRSDTPALSHAVPLRVLVGAGVRASHCPRPARSREKAQGESAVSRLVIVSNRVPLPSERGPRAGGLAVALADALQPGLAMVRLERPAQFRRRRPRRICSRPTASAMPRST